MKIAHIIDAIQSNRVRITDHADEEAAADPAARNPYEPNLPNPAGAGSNQQADLATPPRGDGPWPGVVVLQDAFGMTDGLRGHTERLATAGYVAVAPRLYTARGGGPRCVASVFRAMTSGEGPVFDDIDAARGWPAGRDHCTGTIGVIGFCHGAGFGLIAAARHHLPATAPNYCHVPTEPEPDLEGISPVVASFGARHVALKGHPERLAAPLVEPGPCDTRRHHNLSGLPRLLDSPRLKLCILFVVKGRCSSRECFKRGRVRWTSGALLFHRSLARYRG